MKDNFARIGLVLIAIVIAGFHFFGGSSSATPAAGQPTGPVHYQQEAFFYGFQVGARSNAIAALPWVKGSLIASSFSVVASTSVAMDVAVPNAMPGDAVIAMFATSTPSATGAGWEIVGASASTTPGFDTLRITNGTGATAIIPQSLASSSVAVLNLR